LVKQENQTKQRASSDESRVWTEFVQTTPGEVFAMRSARFGIRNFQRRVQNFKLGVQKFELKVQNFKLKVQNFKLQVQNFKLKLRNFELRGSKLLAQWFKPSSAGFGTSSSKFKISSSGFGTSSAGFGTSSAGFGGPPSPRNPTPRALREPSEGRARWHTCQRLRRHVTTAALIASDPQGDAPTCGELRLFGAIRAEKS
jgi:hypothetical protein